ncbi:SIMPL domain-containing protein [Subsaximicrobium wynnwilliamsii]|uniref:SIMPL domain-containing protein n=1 Tax=Subsaximicrobium wynnwilliamsii TaxID=291179 RepID=A0A5C6ZDD7_9FLAO|nr:SIMPL domain-containing protein [Subsaximicrobium wynnwilliamsii]TXD82265.1 SIMPL domain-containing protein [Subsaximicrobium wynnwilliamsii]TXD87903.1 SIMPL domain-containing protein [Subsaximicrobium wynnwilliamsii]TXE01896.1 SIMPL domain-containing protein [Subsaximicrobium wynnwilliamsii]
MCFHKIFFFSILASTSVFSNAQHKGNYDLLSRQNILHSGNATIYNPVIQQQLQKVLNPSTTIYIDVKALQNEAATTYTAIFNISQIVPTADSTTVLSNQRIEQVRKKLQAVGISKNDLVIDVISFVPNYELEIEKKLFSKTYTEVPKGFELQENLHIRFTKTSQFESILSACAANEIYNLVKVDYYIDNIAEVYKNLEVQLLELITQKKAYYNTLGFDLNNYDVAIADDRYCYFPKDFYQSYQAYNSISFDAIKRKKGVTTAKKQSSYYYQPLSNETFDLVIKPSVLEPVVQIGMNIKLQYTAKAAKPQPAVNTEIKHKYYIVSPNGPIDIKALQTE